MPPRARPRVSRQEEAPRDAVCPFCSAKKDPDYKAYEELKRFVTDRAKIIGRKRSGVCAKHQRRLSLAIKRARFLGLLPFTSAL
ncbi:30S ribosomal protein S18 [Candidatus Woesebacteria bacterium RIFCSPHIGHO2_12_FULL_42_9]|uniref:Small ribosomal subunit protein bS18 n=2 Tax=Candidatus Woeseibacteriota TaxID=1752722 RepID=A0A1F8APP3_9BACT|nr:MAG: 30S ribosomal protein S18 [Candidatus Woesebacteria bacterium GWA1_42_12]OGM53747.1 MAG: 30S ribosomal protein S18 [Candidatus Woesebacteria bacterium RIFCSPHIGHO2_12_FULL_42_9]